MYRTGCVSRIRDRTCGSSAVTAGDALRASAFTRRQGRWSGRVSSATEMWRARL